MRLFFVFCFVLLLSLVSNKSYGDSFLPKHLVLKPVIQQAFDPDWINLKDYDYVDYHFNGLESVIYNKISSLYWEYTNQSLGDYYDSSNITPNDFDRYLDTVWNSREIPFKNYAMEKPAIQEVGESIRILKIGGIAIYNDGKLKAEDIPGLHHIFGHTQELDISNGVSFSNCITLTKNNKFNYIVVTFKPRVTFTVGNNLLNFVSKLYLNNRIIIYSKVTKRPIFIIISEISYKPYRNITQVDFCLQFNIW